MNEIEKGLANLLVTQELGLEEKEKIAAGIDKYLLDKGGIVIAASCQDGILLVGVDPDYEQNIFQVFYRTALLGVGKFKDYKEIHDKAQISAFRTGLRPSKADIDVHEIIKKIAEELEERLNFRTRRPPYKTSFIITELGFNIEEDIVEMVDFEGFRTKIKNAATIEIPIPLAVPKTVMKPIMDKKGKFKTDETGKVQLEQVIEIIPMLKYPVGDALIDLAKKVYVDDYIWTIKEAALFIGLIIRSLDPRGGKLQMAYLDRKMLQKTKTEERRFHHIWNWITDPKSLDPLEPWEDWKKFIGAVYNKVKRGELFSEQKILIELIELFESIEEGKIGKKEEELLKKIGKEHLANLIIELLKKEKGQ